MSVKRNSNIELLRIFAMFLIIIHHSVVHGVLDVSNGNTFSVTWFSSHSLSILIPEILVVVGKVGVDVFVIITGYFMVRSNVKVAKLTKLWVLVWMYSIIMFLISACIEENTFDIVNLITSFFPVILNNYWFMTTFVILYLIIPFLNFFWNNTKMLKYNFMLLVFVINVVMPLLLREKRSLALGASNVMMFVLLYFVGAFLRDQEERKTYNKIGWPILLFFSLLYVISVLVLNFIGLKFNSAFFIKKATYFSGIGANGLFPLGMAIGLFMIVVSKAGKYHRTINIIARSSIAVYLIHDNPFIRNWLWHSVFRMEDLTTSLPLIVFLKILFVAIIVYSVSTLIDIIRILLLSNVENNSVMFISHKIEKMYEVLESKLNRL